MVVEILLVLVCVGIVATLLAVRRRRQSVDVPAIPLEQSSAPKVVLNNASPDVVETANPASAIDSLPDEPAPAATEEVGPAGPPATEPVHVSNLEPVTVLAADPTPQPVVESDPREPRDAKPTPTSNTLVTAQVEPEVAEFTADPVPLSSPPTSSLSASIVIVRPGYVDRHKPQPIKPRSKPQKKSPKIQFRPKRSNRSLFEENWLHNCDLFESGEHYWFDTNQWGSDDWEGTSSAHLSGASELIENVRGEFFTLPRSWGIRDHHDELYWGDFEDDYRDFFHPDELEDPETDEMLSIG